MKKVCLLLITVLSCGASQAQNGFYLAPHIGAGVSQVKPSVAESPFIIGGGGSQSAIFCFNVEMGIGYRFKNFRIQSGIQYLTSGFQLDNIRIHQDPASPYFPAGDDYWKFTYNHLAVPLNIGYTISRKRLSLIPYLGILVSYNSGAKSEMSIKDQKSMKTFTKEEFDDTYNRVSVWGTGMLHLEYKASEKISAFGGPAIKYMINNFGKKDPIFPYNDREQRNQTITIDVGVRVALSSSIPKPTPHTKAVEEAEPGSSEK